MSFLIDRQYIQFISPYLERFRQLSGTVYNFRCPFCGDSQKSQAKARGYLYERNDHVMYHCHNCGIHTTFPKFLEHTNPVLATEYKLEKFKGKNQPKYQPEVVSKPSIEETNHINKMLTKISQLPDDHEAVKLLRDRKIPEIRFPYLYYTKNFADFVKNNYSKYKNVNFREEGRIIIPFYNEKKELIGFQGRSIDPREKKAKYITIKIADGDKFFGIDYIDKDRTVYVVEGPFDSLFIENCIATMDSILYRVGIFKFQDVVLIFDNEPRNRDIVKNMLTAQRLGYKLIVWPSQYKEKDINDMVIAGHSPDLIMRDIQKNTFKGMEALLEINRWKKV